MVYLGRRLTVPGGVGRDGSAWCPGAGYTPRAALGLPGRGLGPHPRPALVRGAVVVGAAFGLPHRLRR